MSPLRIHMVFNLMLLQLMTEVSIQIVSKIWSSRSSRRLYRNSWLVGCFGFNGPLRQYFSLYRAVSQRAGERKGKRQTREKNIHTTPTITSGVGPCPAIYRSSRTPRHWKFTQHHRTTRPPDHPTTPYTVVYKIHKP